MDFVLHPTTGMDWQLEQHWKNGCRWQKHSVLAAGPVAYSTITGADYDGVEFGHICRRPLQLDPMGDQFCCEMMMAVLPPTNLKQDVVICNR